MPSSSSDQERIAWVRKHLKREVLWPSAVCVAHIPVLIGSVLGLIPIHRIVITRKHWPAARAE